MSPTSYQKAIVKFLDPADQIKIEDKLRSWIYNRAGRVVVPNLKELERFLPDDDMYMLLDVIRANHAEPLDQLEKAYERECYGHTARGGLVPTAAAPAIVGKAVDRSVFAMWLWNEYPHKFIRPSSLDEFIDDLIRGEPLEDDEKLFLLGSRYLIWVTWNQSSPTDNPFHFVRFNFPDEVRANVGLEPKPGDRLLLLIYERPHTITLHRPTVADAGLFTFFQPAPSGEDRYGLTRTWDPSFLGVTAPRFDVQPKPEAVHHANEANMELLQRVEQLP